MMTLASRPAPKIACNASWLGGGGASTTTFFGTHISSFCDTDSVVSGADTFVTAGVVNNRNDVSRNTSIRK
jgi:hypothetical protein